MIFSYDVKQARNAAQMQLRALVVMAIALGSVTACSMHHVAPPPNPDAPGTTPPDLSGLPVMILPAQPPPRGSRLRAGASEPVQGLDAEINFFLKEQAPRVQWVTSDAVRKAAANAHSINVHPEALSVSAFSTAQLTRIGDPLWGDLRLLGEVANARYALLPFAAGFAVDTAGAANAASGSNGAETGRVEIGVALIDTGNGNVLWTGYVAGERGMQDAPAVVASAARALARKIAP